MNEHLDTLPRKCNLTDMLAKVAKVGYCVLPDGKTTICTLYMKSGFTVHGKSACVVPEEFNKALGEKYAYEDAVNNLWPLEGYLLAEKRWEFYKADEPNIVTIKAMQEARRMSLCSVKSDKVDPNA